MENNNSAMDTVDWRTELLPDSRQRVVSKITDTLKTNLPYSGEEGLSELKKIAERFEEKIYSSAISLPDYLGKVSLKMLTMETKPNSMPNNQALSNNRPLGIGSLSINKVQPLKMPLQPNQPQTKQTPIGVLNIPSISSSSSSLSSGFAQIQNSVPNLIPQNPNLGSNLPNPIGNLMIGQASVANNNNYLQQQFLLHLQQQQQQQRLNQQNLLQQRSAFLLPPNLLPQATPLRGRAADLNPISLPKLHNQTTLFPGASLAPSATSLISAAQIASVNGADWRDEVYRKIKRMKDLYIPELLELQVKITTSLQECKTVPKNEESEPAEKLKLLNFMLEKAISFLEVSKPNISEKYKNNQELVIRERQIMNFVNMNRPGNLFYQLQQQPPMTWHDGWTAEHQAMQRVQTRPVPQSSSLFSRLGEAVIKIRSKNKKSSSLSEPLFSDNHSMRRFEDCAYWVLVGLALMIFMVLILAFVLNTVPFFSA